MTNEGHPTASPEGAPTVTLGEKSRPAGHQPLPPQPSGTARSRSRPFTRILGSGWAVAFGLPYFALFAIFVAYPVVYGVYLGRDPSDYLVLFGDPTYWDAVKNTALLLLIGVNVKMALALLLSGFFAQPRRWPKFVLLVFLLPWAVPSLPGFLSIRWIFDQNYGVFNTILADLGVAASDTAWLTNPTKAFGLVIGAYIWKWMPFWTLILLAARMGIPQEIYEAAAVDGSNGLKRFAYVTFPLLRNTYITMTLLSTIWTLSDYNTVRFVTNGDPFDSTQVMATLGVKFAFDLHDIPQAVAIALTALPLIVPLIVLLVRRLREE